MPLGFEALRLWDSAGSERERLCEGRGRERTRGSAASNACAAGACACAGRTEPAVCRRGSCFPRPRRRWRHLARQADSKDTTSTTRGGRARAGRNTAAAGPAGARASISRLPSPANAATETPACAISSRATRDINQDRLQPPEPLKGRRGPSSPSASIIQAEQALRERNLIFAATLADKAATLAAELLGR